MSTHISHMTGPARKNSRMGTRLLIELIENAKNIKSLEALNPLFWARPTKELAIAFKKKYEELKGGEK